MISFMRARADSLWGWLAVYAAVVLVASGISVAGISLVARAIGGTGGESFGPPLLLKPGSLAIHTVGQAPGGGDWFLPSQGELGEYLRFARAGDCRVGVLARGTAAGGVWPQLRLVVDDEVMAGVRETSGQWNASTWTVPLSAGVHKIAIRYVNDAVSGSEDRNLLVRALSVRVATGSAAPRVATRDDWMTEKLK